MTSKNTATGPITLAYPPEEAASNGYLTIVWDTRGENARHIADVGHTLCGRSTDRMATEIGDPPIHGQVFGGARDCQRCLRAWKRGQRYGRVIEPPARSTRRPAGDDGPRGLRELLSL